MSETTTALTLATPDNLRAVMRGPDTLARFTEVLGQHSASAYITSVILAVANNDQLQQCSVGSIVTSAMRAATLRLSCDPATKQAHLVPFKGKATLVVGYKGYYDMAQRTGKYRYLNDFKVYEGQEVVEDQLRGTVEIQGYKKPDAQVIGYGFYFEMLSGLKKVLYMTVEEILEHGKKYSKTFTYDSSLWKKDFNAMARKTVIRLCLSRYGYLDPTDQLTLSAVDDTEAEEGEYTLAPPAPRRSIAQNMRELGFEPEPEPEPTAEPEPEYIPEGEVIDEQPALPPLRLQPEALKSSLASKAKTMTGAISPTQKGLIATVIEATLGTPDPKAARKMLLKYLTGHDSLTELTDPMLLALYAWLKPYKNEMSGEWFCDEMAAREARAAFNHCQPPQETLFQ